MRLVLLVAFCFWNLSGGVVTAGDWNNLVLEAIRKMPVGGCYARYLGEEKGDRRYSQLYRTVDDLGKALTVGRDGRLKVVPERAKEFSFCSSATYLVFCEVLATLQSRGVIEVGPAMSRGLTDIGDNRRVIHGERDGIGIFGHWNADGPGTAVLFARLDLGRKFSSLDEAKPGDFLKIFWNDAIGKGERGHLVVYLGMNEKSGAIQVWSSNLANDDGSSGYGTMWIDRSRVFRMIFSRLEKPENLRYWLNFSEEEETSDYLVRIRQVPSTESEMRSAIGLVDGLVD